MLLVDARANAEHVFGGVLEVGVMLHEQLERRRNRQQLNPQAMFCRQSN